MIDRRKIMFGSAMGLVAVQSGPARSATPLSSRAPSSAHGESLNVRDFGAVGDGVVDDTLAIQRAIHKLRDEAIEHGDTSHVRSLLFPSGRYMLSDTISTLPWVKLRSAGSVLFDFSRLPLWKNGIVCRNETMLKPGTLCFPGNRSPFLDGSGGTISVLGPDADRALGWGVVLGNRDARFSGEVRDAGGHNVVVSGWRGALRIDPVNTYLSAWTSCRFERNREDAIYASPLKGPSINSGERMTFYDCTFAQTRRALNVETDSQDFVFDACSFDFLEEVIHFGAGSGYGTVALSHCHIEGIDASIVNADKAGERLRVAIDHSTVLPRKWHGTNEANAPRQLFCGRCKLSAIAVEFRFEAPAPRASTVLIDDDVQVETLQGLSFSGFDCWPCRGHSLNADALFQSDAPGTPVDKLSHWHVQTAQKDATVNAQIVASTNKRGDAPAQNRPRHALRIDASSTGTVTVAAKSRFAVRPGELLAAVLGIEQNGAQGVSSVAIDFYTVDGVWMTRASSHTSKDERRNAGVTNLQTVAPAGAALGRVSIDLTNWRGSAMLTTLATWTLS